MTRTERLAFEAAKREAKRYGDWLRLISWRCRGLGSAYAGIALNSAAWPDGQYAAFDAKRPKEG